MSAALFWALLKALPQLIALLSAIGERVQSARDQRQGYDEAVAEALKQAHDEVVQATAAMREAEERHRQHPTSDEGFDDQFKRPD